MNIKLKNIMEIEYSKEDIIAEEKKFFQLVENLTRNSSTSRFTTTTNIAEIGTLYTYIKSSKVIQMSHIKPLILAIYHYKRKENLS
jgi:hypothetical protein